jgi:hypothetical protein
MFPQNSEGTTCCGDRVDELAANLRDAAQPDAAADNPARPAAPARTITETVGEAIKRHPFAAVGIAFSLGYAAMRLLRR